MAHGITLRPIRPADRDAWLAMRQRLWPGTDEDHAAETEAWFRGDHADDAVFVAVTGDGSPCGFLEAGTRPYAEGCRTSPVGYVEGCWVDEDFRGQGIGAGLMAAAEAWARSLGLSEMASDADLDNRGSHAAHAALGYAETAQIVCYRKALRDGA